MAIYMVTWKTEIVDGMNSEGSFFSEVEEITSTGIAVEYRNGWMNYIKETVTNRQGGNILITGVFKL